MGGGRGVTLGLPQTMDPANTESPQGSQTKSFPFQLLTPNWPLALSSAFPSPTSIRRSPHCDSEYWDPLGATLKTRFHAVKINVITSIPPQQHCHPHPTVWDFASIHLYLFSFLKLFPMGEQEKGGRVGNFLITVVVLLCPTHQ